MQLSFIHDYCIVKKGVEETLPFGPDTLVYKVMGKAFLLCGIEDVVKSINLKCHPDKAVELREIYDCVQPGYHMNKKHWNTVKLDGSVALSLVKEWIDHSYEQVVAGMPKKLKEELARL